MPELRSLTEIIAEAELMHVVFDNPRSVNSPSHGEMRLDPLIVEALKVIDEALKVIELRLRRLG